MKNPNRNSLVMFALIIGGLLIAGISGVIYGVEPIPPLFIVGAVIAFGGITFGVATVRCPYCHKLLHLKGLTRDSHCPNCGKKLE